MTTSVLVLVASVVGVAIGMALFALLSMAHEVPAGRATASRRAARGWIIRRSRPDRRHAASPHHHGARLAARP